MTTMTALSPHEQVAYQFMAHKGYRNIEPSEIEKLEGHQCWYFLYDLPEGTLELEVTWDGTEWDAMVTTFLVD